MRPDKRFKFHTLVTGQGKTKFLIVTAQLADFQAVPGTRVLVSDQARASLMDYLKSNQGQAVAEAWGVSDKMVSRLKIGLGLGGDRGGDRRSDEWQQSGAEPGFSVQISGKYQRKVVIVGGVDLELAPKKNLLVEQSQEAREQFRLWLDNTTINEATEKLAVARNVILFARHWI